MGGIFLIKKGAAHQHVMRDFSSTPINSDEEVNNWLKFYEMPAQLNAVGTLITHENVGLITIHLTIFKYFNYFAGFRFTFAAFPLLFQFQLGRTLSL